MAKTKRYGKRKSHHKKKPAKRTRSKKGSGRMTRLQAGGQPVFVGAPWNGANTNTWGVTNHYAYNPQGSGSGDPLDIVLGTRSTKPGNMIGGKRRYKKKRRGTKKHHKKSSKSRRKSKSKKGGALIDDMNGPGNWIQNQIDRSIAGGSRKRKGKKHARKSRKVKRKRGKRGGKAPPGYGPGYLSASTRDQRAMREEAKRREQEKRRKRSMKRSMQSPMQSPMQNPMQSPMQGSIQGSTQKPMVGGYKGDMPFQNTVNFFRGISNNLGNVVHGFRGYPEVAGPSPVDQPGMEPPRMPVPMPADIETLYKNAQTHVGSIGTV